jgi:hypothetical protein
MTDKEFQSWFFKSMILKTVPCSAALVKSEAPPDPRQDVHKLLVEVFIEVSVDDWVCACAGHAGHMAHSVQDAKLLVCHPRVALVTFLVNAAVLSDVHHLQKKKFLSIKVLGELPGFALVKLLPYTCP